MINPEMTSEEVLKNTFFVIAATHFEEMCLREQTSYTENVRQFKAYLHWGETVFSEVITVGQIDGFPVNITARWIVINGKLIMFWNPCSRVVDYEMIDSWIKTYFRQGSGEYRITDAMNFGLCFKALKGA